MCVVMGEEALPAEAQQAIDPRCPGVEQIEMLQYAMPGAVFLLNSIYGPNEVWD